jgi:uncharacterized integral membrane protein
MAQSPTRRGRNWTLRLVSTAVALAMLVFFIAENFVVVEVRLLTRHVELRLAWAVLLTGLLGILIGLVLPKLWR